MSIIKYGVPIPAPFPDLFSEKIGTDTDSYEINIIRNSKENLSEETGDPWGLVESDFLSLRSQLDVEVPTTSLLEKLKAHSEIATCKFAKVIGSLHEEEQIAIEKALDNPDFWSAKEIYDILISEGHKVSYDGVKVHRRRACVCYKKVSK